MHLDGRRRIPDRIWASFPGSTSGQPQKALTDLEAYYQSVGGVLS
jgi:hypothetical protein